MTVLEFRLLGDFEVRLDDRVLDAGHPRQRCVLAVLLVEANHGVSIDRLVDRVWRHQQPQRARRTMHAYISRLRRALSPSAAVITRRSGGYCLTVDPLAVDLYRFRHLIAQARAARADEDAALAFAEALQLWRGEAFTGLDIPWLDACASVWLRASRLPLDAAGDAWQRNALARSRAPRISRPGRGGRASR